MLPKTKPPVGAAPAMGAGADATENPYAADCVAGAISSLFAEAPNTKPTPGTVEELSVDGLEVVTGAAAHEGIEEEAADDAADAHAGTTGAADGTVVEAGPDMSLSQETHFFALFSLGTIQAGHFTVSALAALAQIDSLGRATTVFVSSADEKETGGVSTAGLADDEKLNFWVVTTTGIKAFLVSTLDAAAVGVAPDDSVAFFRIFGGENTYLISF